ncbi:hypothetical protein GCM10009504_47590 [Pseudomonas laurentiana]|nr:hypothetical protein GCM10009504_47590 [Pseudomonas laurentiana]
MTDLETETLMLKIIAKPVFGISKVYNFNVAAGDKRCRKLGDMGSTANTSTLPSDIE